MKTKPSEAIVNNVVVESSVVKKEVDYNKQWNNGHKVLTTSESGALTELLHQEERARIRFDHMKGGIMRPRNPLNGEPTPRDSRGEVVMNPKNFSTITNGLPILREYSDTDTATMRRKKAEPLQGKIGVNERKYEVLGNTGMNLSPSQPQDLFMFSTTINQQKLQKQEERAKISEYVAKEKAKRYEKDLAREIHFLQQQVEEKAKKLTLLQTHFLR
ncbi:hypothetical protein EON65_10015 [archaeon]|nr:MAG: hypothetical protein EON65_10015 [archaeon]